MAESPIGSREKPPLPDDLPLWKSLGLMEERGKPVINEDNLQRVLENDANIRDAFWYDEFHDKIFTTLGRNAQFNGHIGEYTDTENLHLLTYIQNHLGIVKAKKILLFDAMIAHANRSPRNEAKDWMETLKHDGSPRIDNFMSDALGAEPSIYTRAVSKNFWLSMAARIYQPGCQVDNMVVLEGTQGIGKNRALRAIGKNWYTQAPGTPDDKDFYLAFRGKLLIEFGELDAFKRSEQTKIKACITCTTDNYRSPYERTSMDHPRQCVFVGTTNEFDWIPDTTGARRFWPIKCDLIDIDYIEKNRDQLFAEAVSRLKAAESWWEVPETALAEQEARRTKDPWEDLINEWLKGHPEEVIVLDVATASDCLNMAPEKLTMFDSKRIGNCLRLAGRKKRHASRGNVWYIPA